MSLKPLTLVKVEDIPKNVLLTPTDDLIAVYKVCLQLEDICKRKKMACSSAIQVGIPWSLFVLCHWPAPGQDFKWHYYLNYSYKPLSEEKTPYITRFPNVETKGSRYFKVDRYKDIEYHVHELIVKNQPELVEITGKDDYTGKNIENLGMFIHHSCELEAGNYPHLAGEEYWLNK